MSEGDGGIWLTIEPEGEAPLPEPAGLGWYEEVFRRPTVEETTASRPDWLKDFENWTWPTPPSWPSLTTPSPVALLDAFRQWCATRSLRAGQELLHQYGGAKKVSELSEEARPWIYHHLMHDLIGDLL